MFYKAIPRSSCSEFFPYPLLLHLIVYHKHVAIWNSCIFKIHKLNNSISASSAASSWVRKHLINVTCSEKRFQMHWVSGRVSWGPPPAHFQVQLPRSPHTSQQWSRLSSAQARSAYRENPAPANTCSKKWKSSLSLKVLLFHTLSSEK